ncbi:hypothetical protein [Sulfitobacter sp. CS16]|uniref:hypothetical protein n=1 Tax=Sulfitobacter sp. CS16 TaxID=3368573 RepID=UPI003744C339
MFGKSFSAQIADFEKMAVKDMRYVAAESIQDVMEAAQTPQRGIGQGATGFEVGKIPVNTSELINSLTSEGVRGADSYTVAIAGYQVGDVMSFAWTAPHALAVEAGTKNMPGRFFVGANARRFPAFVEARAKEVRR